MADNFNNNQLDLISSGTSPYTFDENVGDYIQVIVSNQAGDVVTLNDGSLAVFSSHGEDGDFQIYKDTSNSVFVKPIEILSQTSVPSGNYKLRFDFLRNWFDDEANVNFTFADDSRFYINQISPSRKEIRLLGRQNANENLDIDGSFISNFELILGKTGNQNNPYKYDYVTRLDNGSTLPITNYVFDGTGARSQMRDKTEKSAILQVGDKKLTIAAADVTTTPNSKDRILVGSNSLQIVDIKTTELNGKAITYELFLRIKS